MTNLTNYGEGPKTIYNLLKQQIIFGELEPGQELKILPFSKLMNVSIVPLREAIRMLAAERFVELRPRRSPVIASLDLGELMEMNRIRGALEPLILEDAVSRHTLDTMSECEAILARINAATDPWEIVRLNKLFHISLLRPSRMNRALDIVSAQYDAITRITQFRVVNHGLPIGHLNSEHQAILTAVRARNSKQAATLMSEHIKHATIRAQCELANEQVARVP